MKKIVKVSGEITNVNVIKGEPSTVELKDVKIQGGITMKTIVKVSGEVTNVNVIKGEPTIVEIISESYIAPELLKVIEASKLSLDDEFMQYEPRTEEQKRLKEELVRVIKKGIKDFVIPKTFPRIKKGTDDIIYCANLKDGDVAYGRTPAFWKEFFKDFMPERNSRLCSLDEYYALCGVYMKEVLTGKKKWSSAPGGTITPALVSVGCGWVTSEYSKDVVWSSVCDRVLRETLYTAPQGVTVEPDWSIINDFMCIHENNILMDEKEKERYYQVVYSDDGTANHAIAIIQGCTADWIYMDDGVGLLVMDVKTE